MPEPHVARAGEHENRLTVIADLLGEVAPLNPGDTEARPDWVVRAARSTSAVHRDRPADGAHGRRSRARPQRPARALAFARSCASQSPAVARPYGAYDPQDTRKGSYQPDVPGRDGRKGANRVSLSDAAEVVLEPDDVVLAEVVAVLHLDEHEIGVAGVLDPVRHAERRCRPRRPGRTGDSTPSSVTTPRARAR